MFLPDQTLSKILPVERIADQAVAVHPANQRFVLWFLCKPTAVRESRLLHLILTKRLYTKQHAKFF
jgi:hypothetical protein